MKKIKYLDILKDAFLITWKNKFLWILGLIVLFGSIASNLNVNTDSIVEQGKRTLLSTLQSNSIFNLFLIALIIALFFLRIVAVAGIIRAVNDISLYRQLSIKAIMREARKYLGRLLLLELLIGISLFLVAIVLATPVIYLFTVDAKLLAILASILAVAIILPLFILAYYLYKYASLHIILADEKIKISLETAYILFAENTKESLAMGITIIGTNLLLVVGVAAICLLLAILFAPIALISYWIFAKVGVLAVSIVGLVCFILILGAVLSWYETFMQAIWLLFFQQIAFEKYDEKKTLEKIEIEGKIPNPEAI